MSSIFSKPSMPAPPPAPVDPSQTPAAIQARADAAREAEIASNNGMTRNMVAGQMMADQNQQKIGAARTKLGYSSTN